MLLLVDARLVRAVGVRERASAALDLRRQISGKGAGLLDGLVGDAEEIGENLAGLRVRVGSLLTRTRVVSDVSDVLDELHDAADAAIELPPVADAEEGRRGEEQVDELLLFA